MFIVDLDGMRPYPKSGLKTNNDEEEEEEEKEMTDNKSSNRNSAAIARLEFEERN